MLAPLSPAMQPMTAAPPKYHDVTIKGTRRYECARVEGVPPEEFGIARNARSIKDAGYCFHEVIRFAADLLGEGYDATQVKALPTYTGLTNIETQSRDTVEERSGSGGDESNDATRQVKITEHYIRMDYDGSGPAMWKVLTGGDQGEVLKIDDEDNPCRVDFAPFAAMTPVIVTHRFFGRSIADLVMDIQRIKTALVRGMLDNMYSVIRPRPIISEQGSGDSTLDDLLIAEHGRPIRVKGSVSDALGWTQTPDISAPVLQGIQYWDATREWRTGVSRQGQGVDPNALQNQVATIANQMFNAAQAKSKLIARIFAETGIKDLFLLLHATIRKHGSKPQTVRLRNQWVPINPREWKTRDDMTVKVGLGDGSKSDQLAGAQMLANAQAQSIAFGLVSKKNLYNSNKQLCRLLGHKNPDDYFVDPNAPPDQQDPSAAPLPPPPDPKQAEIAAKAQAEQMKMQQDAAHSQAKLQGDLAHQKMKTEADVHVQATKVQADIAMAQQKFALDSRLAQEKHLMEMEKLKADMMKTAAEHQQKMHETATDHQAARDTKAHKANATIEVKHGAEELTGPLAHVVEALGQHLTNHAAQQTEHMAKQHEVLHHAIKSMSSPKRVRKNKDGSWQSETVQ